MTAGGTRTVAATLKLGVTDFITKPVAPEPVRAAHARALAVPVESLRAEPQRALVVGAPDCAAALAGAQPAFVEVGRVAELEEAAAHRGYRLVVVDLR